MAHFAASPRMARWQSKVSSMNIRLLALDFGDRRIGLAAASMPTRSSSAIGTILARNGVPDWPELDKAVREWTPNLLVIGMPYNMDGTKSAMTDRVLHFVDVLIERYGLPVEPVDERLTSVEARNLLKEQRRQGIRSKKLKREEVDSLAAKIIAETWINQSNLKP